LDGQIEEEIGRILAQANREFDLSGG